MGRHKEKLERQEEGCYAAAERHGRRCWVCSAVIPYGVAKGPNEECPACIGALSDDDSKRG